MKRVKASSVRQVRRSGSPHPMIIPHGTLAELRNDIDDRKVLPRID